MYRWTPGSLPPPVRCRPVDREPTRDLGGPDVVDGSLTGPGTGKGVPGCRGGRPGRVTTLSVKESGVDGFRRDLP